MRIRPGSRQAELSTHGDTGELNGMWAGLGWPTVEPGMHKNQDWRQACVGSWESPCLGVAPTGMCQDQFCVGSSVRPPTARLLGRLNLQPQGKKKKNYRMFCLTFKPIYRDWASSVADAYAVNSMPRYTQGT